MQKLNLSKTNLRKFGIIMAATFLIVAVVIYLKCKEFVFWPFFVSGVFGSTGIGVPVLLKPVYIVWMKLAFVLSWINTRLILFAIFYVIITPIGIIMRLCGSDSLDKKTEKNRLSYWKKREEKKSAGADYERQF